MFLFLYVEKLLDHRRVDIFVPVALWGDTTLIFDLIFAR